MGKNRKVLVISSVLLFTALIVFSILYFSGSGIGGRFLGKNTEQTVDTGDTNNAASTMDSIGTNTQNQTVTGTRQNQDTGTNQANTTESSTNREKFKGIKVKAVYLTGVSAGSKTKLNQIIKMINDTELNAVVIDIKEGGKVNYKSSVPAVVKNNSYVNNFDVDKVIKLLHENNIYVIGRIVCFKDSSLAAKRPDLAIRGTNGSTTAWTNPYIDEVDRYNIDIAREAADKGFDEIQFDYVRFPNAGDGIKKADYGSNMPSKSEAINKFLYTAKKELEVKGVPVSADVFGIICENPASMDSLGQVLEEVGKNIDYISPMLYPSHYANASHGGTGQHVNGILFTTPDLKPYEVVYNALLKAKNRISKVDGYKAGVRPYLQGFTASYLSKGYYQEYGPVQIRQQIKAVYDAGYSEWIIWNGRNVYYEDSFLKE